MKLTIKNAFHNTQVTINTEIFRDLTSNQITRARKKLCGMSDCICNPFDCSDDSDYQICENDDNGYFVAPYSILNKFLI